MKQGPVELPAGCRVTREVFPGLSCAVAVLPGGPVCGMLTLPGWVVVVLVTDARFVCVAWARYGGAARLAKVLRRRLRVFGGSPAAARRAFSASRVFQEPRMRWLRTIRGK